MKTLLKIKKFPATPKVLKPGTVTNSSCSQLSKQFLKLKCIIAFITLLFLMHFTLASYSQYLVLNEETRKITPRKIENTTLIDFKAIYNTGYVYIKWRVKNETEDGLFIIERSSDNTNFEIIAFEQRIGVPISLPILYCSIDKRPLQGTSYYRLVNTYRGGRHYYSKVITLVTPQQTVDDLPERAQQSAMNWGNEESNIVVTGFTKP